MPGSMETLVSSGIIESYFRKLQSNLVLDAAIVVGGLSGIVVVYYLAKAEHEVALFGRNPGAVDELTRVCCSRMR